MAIPCCWRTSSDTSSTSCTRGAGRTRRRLGDGADWRRHNPGTNLVTHFMALNVANPVMDVEPTLCCLTHDIGNHTARLPDRPWQRALGSAPGGHDALLDVERLEPAHEFGRKPSASAGPEHQGPVRFNADMSAKTNYLFARVEQTVNPCAQRGRQVLYEAPRLGRGRRELEPAGPGRGAGRARRGCAPERQPGLDGAAGHPWALLHLRGRALRCGAGRETSRCWTGGSSRT